jgi:anti-sigma B factor antagonist
MPLRSTDAGERHDPRAGAVCFRVSDPGGTGRVMLVGEIDLVTAERARAAIRRAQDETRTLTCDLGDVWFVDLSGLRVLLDAAKHATLTGGRLTLANCPPIVPRMLRVLDLEHALEIQAPPRSSARRFRFGRVRGHVG